MPPPEPHPVAGGDWWPHVIAHVPQDDGTVLVTWSLPGLQRATVRVPLATWLDGHHQPTGRFLASLINPLLVDARQSPPHPKDEQ